MVENKRQGIENFLKDVTLITPEIFKNVMNNMNRWVSLSDWVK